VPEIEYTPNDYGWFKVSRRLVTSSRWFTCSPGAIKLLVYMLEQASNPMSPHPGDILQVGSSLAVAAGLPDEGEFNAALSDLLGPDEDSQSTKEKGAFVVPLTRNEKTVGYRIVNFDEYNPGVRERSEVMKKQRRRAAAKKAAAARWGKAEEALATAHKAEAKAIDPDDVPF
jgi:hypothetical protein